MTYPYEVISSMERWRLNEHQGLSIHPREGCSGHCAFHNPSDHHMVTWKLWWRDDWGGFLERICPHGIGHPDPDQITFWRQSQDPQEAEARGIHGCCGCCLDSSAHREGADGDAGAGDVQQ